MVGTAWKQQTKLTSCLFASDGADVDFFGSSITVDGVSSANVAPDGTDN
jgi:hypothetical protein